MRKMKSRGNLIVSILVLVLVLLAGAFSCTAKPTKAGGTIVMAMTDLGTEVWLPDQTTASITPVSSLYEFLVYKDSEGKVIPGLAEKWEVSPDGRTYTFHLSKGIQFHDGWGELTADDIKYSFELSTAKGTRNAMLSGIGGLAEVINPYTVVFRFEQYTPLLMRVSREYFESLAIVSKKYVEKVGIEQAGRHPIGTGPYKFVEHALGDHITFEAVENHWRKTPQFKTLIIKEVPEEASRVAMLRTGEADIIDMSLEFTQEVVKSGFKIKSSPGSAGYCVFLGGQWLPTVPTFDAKYPWVGDPRDPKSWERALKVRKALNLAVNRDEIINTILFGEAQPLAAPLAHPGTEMYDPALKPYPYDVEEAKRLLAEAGYPNGFDITLLSYTLSGRGEAPIIAGAVAMMWQKIGVNVKLQATDFPTVKAMTIARKTPGVAWIHGGTFYDGPVEGYKVMAYSKATTSSLFGFETLDLDNLIEKTSTEPNDEKRVKLHRQITHYVYDNYLAVTIAVKNATWGVSNRVGDWPLAAGMNYPTNWESITYGPAFKP